MNEGDQIRRVCEWNRNLSRENRELRCALGESQEAVAQAGVERDTALIFLDSAWRAAEGKQP
jgi:hypothetical protein